MSRITDNLKALPTIAGMWIGNGFSGQAVRFLMQLEDEKVRLSLVLDEEQQEVAPALILLLRNLSTEEWLGPAISELEATRMVKDMAMRGRFDDFAEAAPEFGSAAHARYWIWGAHQTWFNETREWG